MVYKDLGRAGTVPTTSGEQQARAVKEGQETRRQKDRDEDSTIDCIIIYILKTLALIILTYLFGDSQSTTFPFFFFLFHLPTSDHINT